MLGHLDRSKPDRPALPALRVRPGTLTFICTPLLARHTLDAIGALRRAGQEVALVDTFPTNLDRQPSTTANALRLRALERGDDLDLPRRQGIPISRWQGGASLTPLMAALAASRGPRRARR